MVISAAARLMDKVKRRTDMISERYPPRNDGKPDTVKDIVEHYMQALTEMKVLFKSANQAKALCNQLGEVEQLQIRSMFLVAATEVEEQFQKIILEALTVRTKMLDSINRLALLTAAQTEPQGLAAARELIGNMTDSANLVGNLHSEMSDGLEEVVRPALARAMGK
ncbi:MAG: hypothetical protein KDK24_20580 [Pseudooceanicola sp.]|nr:hypothetical protein [Pseudooceanicola sp.]